MNRLRALHRWTGLTAGCLFTVVAMTGALMAFRVQLEPLLSPALLTVPACTAPLPPDALVAAARASSPASGDLDAVRLYGDATFSARVRFSDGRWIYVDPCSARVLGSADVYGGAFGTLAKLHIFGYLPFGQLLAGGLALLMALAMAGAGMRLWWPSSPGGRREQCDRQSRFGLRGLRRLGDSLRLKPGLRGRAFNLNLHKTAAIYAAPVLLASALTGLPQAFGWARDALDIISASAPQPAAQPIASPIAPPTAAPPAKPPSSHSSRAGRRISSTAAHPSQDTAGPMQRATLAAIWQQLRYIAPYLQKAQLRAPRGPDMPIVVEVVERDAPHANAAGYFYFHPATGALLRHTPYAENSRGHRLYLWALALHYGWLGGVAGQLLLMLGALAVPLLAWTGTASYLRGLRQRGAGPAGGASAADGNRAVPGVRAGLDQGLRLLVVRKQVEAEGICSFELAGPDGGPLPPYAAGAHLEVLTPGGHIRHYSLCGDPRDSKCYRIGVLRCPDSRGGSRAMHEELHAGDAIETSLPRNHFPLAMEARHSVLLAGGIGITPILAMAEQLAANGASFELHYCCRSEHHAAFHAALDKPHLAQRVQYHYSVGRRHSRLDLAALLAAPAPGTHVYACGPLLVLDL